MPFQLTTSGQVATTSDPRVQAEQHVAALVSTNPGDRVMLPAYGVPLSALVFASNDPVIVTTIQRDVAQAIAQWEPGIIVKSITPSQGSDPTQGVAMVDVDFQAGAQPGAPGAGTQRATILIGGTVVQDGS